MSRLIDADALKKKIDNLFKNGGFDSGLVLECIDNAPTIEERPKCDVLNKIPKDFVYDTETSEFYCYRNKYTGEEIHIIKPPKTYSVPEIWEEISKEKSEKRWGISYLHQDSITKSDTDMRGDV